jgi:hypothetical protein
MQTFSSPQGGSDYNNMVDEIFSLKPKELSIKRRDYIKKFQNYSQNYFFTDEEQMERYKFADDSESDITDHFNKIFQQKEESEDEINLNLTYKEVDESGSQDSSKYEFSFDMLDIDKGEFENISIWNEFLLHEFK